MRITESNSWLHKGPPKKSENMSKLRSFQIAESKPMLVFGKRWECLGWSAFDYFATDTFLDQKGGCKKEGEILFVRACCDRRERRFRLDLRKSFLVIVKGW